MNNIITFDKVSKSFGDLKVLDQLNLEVKDGEKLALIGPSGSGKTTILRILMTLETIDSGFVSVNNEYLWHEKINDKVVPATDKHLQKMRDQIGMVFQQFNLFPHLTAIENVKQPQILVKKKNESEAKEKAEDLFNMIGLSDKIDHYPHQLSGGQQQRVAIARALAMDPDVILFDEPTSALDPELVGEVLKVMRNLAEEGRTMLVVTHEIGFAKEASSSVAFFHQGIIEEQGKPQEVLSKPRSSVLKNFLSTIM